MGPPRSIPGATLPQDALKGGGTDCTIPMVMAEISVLPVGTGQTSVSFYVARALESVSDTPGLRCSLNAMGTIMESDDLKTILEATQVMIETLHNLDVSRVSVMLKIDSRLDKSSTAGAKVESVRNQL